MNLQMMAKSGRVPARVPCSHGKVAPRLPGPWTSLGLREEASEKIPPPWGLDSFQAGELASIQEPTQSSLIRTKDTHTSQEIPRILGALCPGQVKDQQSKQKMPLVL